MISGNRVSPLWSMCVVLPRSANTHQADSDAIGVLHVAPVGSAPATGCMHSVRLRGNVMAQAAYIRQLKKSRRELIYAAVSVVSTGLLSTALAATGDLSPAWHRLALAATVLTGVAIIAVACVVAVTAAIRAAAKNVTKRLDQIEQEQYERDERVTDDAVSRAIDAWQLHQTRTGMRRDG